MDLIPILIPSVPSAEKIYPYLLEIETNRQYTNFGPLSIRLIGRLSEYFGLPSTSVVLSANATLAIQGALETANVGAESIWEIPSWTFTATASAAVQSKTQFRFVDVSNDGRAIFSDNANCVLDVLPFGGKTRFAQISKNVKKIIVDAAASIDSLKNIQFPSNVSVGIIVSLHSTKLLPAGEGGVFLTNDQNWAERFRKWTNFGMDDSRVSSTIGTNAKFSEFSAAVAHASLDSWAQTRLAYHQLTLKALELSHFLHLDSFSTLSTDNISPYWILQLENNHQKNYLQKVFEKDLIQYRDWWPKGCHSMPAYQVYCNQDFPNTERLISQTIGIPFHLFLSDSDWNRLEQSLLKIC